MLRTIGPVHGVNPSSLEGTMISQIPSILDILKCFQTVRIDRKENIK